MGRKKKMPLAVNRGEVPGKVRRHFPAHPDPARTVGATRLPAVSAPRISSSHASPQTCPNPNEVTSRGRGEPRRAGGAGTAFREAELRQETSPRSEANSRGLLPRAAVRGAARRGARGLRRAGRSPWRVSPTGAAAPLGSVRSRRPLQPPPPPRPRPPRGSASRLLSPSPPALPPALPSFSPPLLFCLPLTFWPYLCWRLVLPPIPGSVPWL